MIWEFISSIILMGITGHNTFELALVFILFFAPVTVSMILSIVIVESKRSKKNTEDENDNSNHK